MTEKGEKMINIFKKKRKFYVILFLAFIAFILFFTINVARKKPMVFPVWRESESSPFHKEAVSSFADTFVRNLNLTDSFGIKEKLPIALSMMASPLQERYKRGILTAGKLYQVKERGWRSRTKILHRNFRIKGDIIIVNLIYARNIQDTIQNTRFSVNNRAEIKIQALSQPTSDYPDSLQVISYNTQQDDYLWEFSKNTKKTLF